MAIPTAPGGPSGPDSGPEGPPPTCYRHQGRETYVSCVRCGRPACPDCLRPAAVGQQCVDCVRAGAKDVRRPSAARGVRRQLLTGATVTWILVGLNVLCYLGEIFFGNALVYHGAMFSPYVADGQWYRLLTSAFLHEPPNTGIGPLHILFNMWALIAIGPAVEAALGRLRFATVYVMSALGGSVLFYLIAPVNTLALGASGAIFGLFAAYFVVARRVRADTRQILVLIVINLVITFAAHDVIAWQDHVGGLIAGGLLTGAFVYARGRQARLVQVAATAGLLAVLIAVVVLRDVQLAGSVRL